MYKIERQNFHTESQYWFGSFNEIELRRTEHRRCSSSSGDKSKTMFCASVFCSSFPQTLMNNHFELFNLCSGKIFPPLATLPF